MSKCKALSWKPRRMGDVYCAPACGRGCTYAEYELACKAADKLASKLPGFKPRVWENLGWHYSADALRSHISVSREYSVYRALADINMSHAGNTAWGSGTGKTAQEAVNQIKRNLRREIAKMQKFLGQLEALGVGER